MSDEDNINKNIIEETKNTKENNKNKDIKLKIIQK